MQSEREDRDRFLTSQNVIEAETLHLARPYVSSSPVYQNVAKFSLGAEGRG